MTLFIFTQKQWNIKNFYDGRKVHIIYIKMEFYIVTIKKSYPLTVYHFLQLAFILLNMYDLIDNVV